MTERRYEATADGIIEWNKNSDNREFTSLEQIAEIMNDLQERNERQTNTIVEQQNMIDDYIDVKAIINAKITEYNVKSEEYQECACGCMSKQYYHFASALQELKDEVYK